MKRIGLEGSFAIAEAVRLANIDVIAAYPITPQTHIVERLAELVAEGKLDADYIPVESEHSAMSACMGASAVGARTFTATAGPGLELMHETLAVASGLRLPIVMAVANRALSNPLSIWGDHSDVMAARDCGWIQIFAENVQQAFDLILCAYRIAEDAKVLIPTMVNIDGFHLSHVIEPLYLISQEEVNQFLPPYQHPYVLDPDKPTTMGAFGIPSIYTEAKKAQDFALRSSKENILQVWEAFDKLSGRKYSPIEMYQTENTDILLLTMGSFGETAMMAIDEMRDDGEKVGLLKLRLWRPFPFEELRAAVKTTKILIVLDRAISIGGPMGTVCSEIQAALYPVEPRPKIVGIVGGLGGRDMSPETFKKMIRLGIDKANRKQIDELEIIEVRG